MVAAWQESGAIELLEKAADRFADEPRVQLAMLSTDLSAEQRAIWIERFKAAAPDNALANYYAAENYLRQKNMQLAVAELAAADSKDGYDDYLPAIVDEREALFLAAGLSPLEAETHALFGLPMNYLVMLNGLSQGLTPLIETRMKNADTPGASELAAFVVSVAEKMQTGSGSGIILNELVAIAMETKVLQALDTASAAPAAQTLKNRLEELRQRREEIQELARNADITSADVSGGELTQYLDILVSQGEMSAMRWLKAQRP